MATREELLILEIKEGLEKRLDEIEARLPKKRAPAAKPAAKKGKK